MEKKIFDIAPPIKRETSIYRKPEGSHKGSFWGFFVGLIIILFLIFGLYFASGFYSRLTLYLTPRTESKSFETELEVNILKTGPDLNNRIIPGRFFETEREKRQKFESTGKDFLGGKAQGTIRVYNSTSPARAVTLRATTRFLSAEGAKIFRAPAKIYLPPAKVIGGKVTPSFKDIKVVAQEAGEDYNIGASKFSVPGLAGSPLYYTIWAESESSMTGGFKKEIKIITEEDLKKAKKVLETGLKDSARNSLKNKLPENFVFNEKAVFVKDFNSSCVGDVGDKAPEFNCQAKIKIGVLSFKLSDLKKVAQEHILANIPTLKDFDSQSLTLETEVKNLIRESGKMILGLRLKTNLYDKISDEILINKIKGKHQDKIREIILRDYPRVENTRSEFWPFWVRWIKKAPRSPERIRIEIKP